MKKFLSCVLTVILVLSVVGAVSACEGTDDRFKEIGAVGVQVISRNAAMLADTLTDSNSEYTGPFQIYVPSEIEPTEEILSQGPQGAIPATEEDMANG